MDLNRIENELKKRLDFPYKWGRKQSDFWDSETKFIYKSYTFESLLQKTEVLNQELRDYALNRWYNFWSAVMVENLFALHQKVIPNKNSFDKLVDFKINEVSFDHKTTIFPRRFNHSFEYAQQNKKELIKWLYNNQSQQGRKHLKNRLFIVIYDSKAGEHWKLKSELGLLKVAIDNYIDQFSEENLEALNFGNGEVFSDILWIKK